MERDQNEILEMSNDESPTPARLAGERVKAASRAARLDLLIGRFPAIWTGNVQRTRQRNANAYHLLSEVGGSIRMLWLLAAKCPLLQFIPATRGKNGEYFF